MKPGKDGGPQTVRAVLLERQILRPSGSGANETLVVFARANWGSSKRAEFKAWIQLGCGRIKDVPDELRTRSRSLAACRDPILAQEWAWLQWDEYINELWKSLMDPSEPASPAPGTAS